MPLAGEIIDAGDVPGSWSTYTPTLTGTTSGGTVGNGTITGRYIRLGDLVIAMVNLTWGSTTSMGVGSGQISLPVSARATDPGHAGHGLLIDASGGRIPCSWEFQTVDKCIAVRTSDGGIMTSSVPWTWTTSDIIRATFTYEAA